MPVIRLTKRSSEGSVALIAAAVVSCVAAALLTLGGLWFYHRWLRRKREQAALEALDKVSPASSQPSPSNYPPPPAYPPLRAPRRARRPLITKPSIPDLPRISEERMSMASVTPSVQSRPSTFVSLGQQGQLWSTAVAQEKETEEVMGS
ncbi:uncharacterized protein CcaverHIS019_0405870 [Cutaneotrichosporon cavernicola]|uniref:Uncharacterized protein n=1 Tax=Cutaneotrichosporon cavernicola TaxID=279322 RepID=A0AA48L4F5_9TREE|nr:uncharacterized protein CcaverHIS019_0405870 [Cutaneotrichosporon cavernicola]BEI91767.1 hypothetical protein CcaverHIS019_0405870 [Cutaneotrichosporon cavernicola]BEI99539.1 hypothetical protein CcaverHIS631_0405820 [Cutaneotrichosporon cavernicola]BEJ07316.1 hypothetical protein CcaverHIS641_0405850 [Cutaneotrichosporon cavernicola]